jgi:hypothetical protein
LAGDVSCTGEMRNAYNILVLGLERIRPLDKSKMIL